MVGIVQCISVPQVQASYSKYQGTWFFFSSPSLCISGWYWNVPWIHKIFKDYIKKKDLEIKGKSPNNFFYVYTGKRVPSRPTVKLISTSLSLLWFPTKCSEWKNTKQWTFRDFVWENTHPTVLVSNEVRIIALGNCKVNFSRWMWNLNV